MNIGVRLKTIGDYVPSGVSIADIGTDHAYLPAWLAERGIITKAVAGDIAEGPCNAARSTVAMYGLKDKIEVRLGSGLSIVKPGEVDVIVIAGMGASTIIEILEADKQTAQLAKQLILQPMAGAPSLRRWANCNGWRISAEALVEEGKHLYEIMVLERGLEATMADVIYEIGPRLLEQKPPLLKAQFNKLREHYKRLLTNMQRSAEAQQSMKYKEVQKLLLELEALEDGSYGK